VPVPHVEIAPVQGLRCAISYVHSSLSYPLAEKGALSDQPHSPAVKTALRQASGLLPFLAWIAANDHLDDDTNLVVDVLDNNHCRVLAMDFEHAFAWEQGEDVIYLPVPPALEANVDPLLVSESLAVIEMLTPSQISGCCAVLENIPVLQEHIERVLKLRQLLLRQPLASRGFLA
jgi:hypothetical protein